MQLAKLMKSTDLQTCSALKYNVIKLSMKSQWVITLEGIVIFGKRAHYLLLDDCLVVYIPLLVMGLVYVT